MIARGPGPRPGQRQRRLVGDGLQPPEPRIAGRQDFPREPIGDGAELFLFLRSTLTILLPSRNSTINTVVGNQRLMPFDGPRM